MDKKEEYLNELLENPGGAQVLSDKLSQLLDDKEFLQIWIACSNHRKVVK